MANTMIGSNEMAACQLCGQKIDIMLALSQIRKVPAGYQDQVIGLAMEEINNLRKELAQMQSFSSVFKRKKRA
jgi:hypothetical protein